LGKWVNTRISYGNKYFRRITYLLTNLDFENANKHIKKYFKEIFIEELNGIWTDENDWPQKRDFKTFCDWFSFEVSDWVQDLSTKPLFDDDL